MLTHVNCLKQGYLHRKTTLILVMIMKIMKMIISVRLSVKNLYSLGKTAPVLAICSIAQPRIDFSYR